MSPKVSVIVPNYNHARFLRQRLDSIFNQTFQDFEVIILDDCSTDNSKEIIEEFRKRPQVSHIVFNETNSGSPFKQWAKGFDLAQGEYIWIAESDDWAELNFLEIMVSCLNSNGNIALVFSASNWVYLDHEDKVLLHSNNFEMNGIEFIKKRMICGNSIQNASAVIFRKENIKHLSNNYINFKGSGDYQFWINLCETGNVSYISSCLNNFRRHHESTTEKNNINGKTFEENHDIFIYMSSRGYISSLEKKIIASFYLTKIKRSSNKNLSDEFINLWQNEINIPLFYQSLCFFIGLCLRSSPTILKLFFKKKISWSYYYDNFSTQELIWNTFHLPNTNFHSLFAKR